MPELRPCDHCRTEFAPRKSKVRYCSKRCSNLARWDAGLYGPRYTGAVPWHVDYYRRNVEKQRQYQLALYHANPSKQAARNLARKWTPVLTCEVERCDKLGDRHHDDYSRPLDVRYLCRSHHIAFHKRSGRAA